LLTQQEIERLKLAYTSRFYAELVKARREVADAIDRLDLAIDDYKLGCYELAVLNEGDDTNV